MTITAHPATFVGAHLSLDLFTGRPAVLGGGNVNATRAYRHVAEHLGLEGRPQTLAFMGADDMIDPDIELELITVPGRTRVNTISDGGVNGEQLTEYGHSSLKITSADIERMIGKITRAEEDSWVALTGSLPPGMTADFFITVIKLLQRLKVNVLLDTRPELLGEVLAAGVRPSIIKPNRRELELITGETIDPQDDEQLLRITGAVLPDGIVIASLGRDGVFLNNHGRYWRIRATLPLDAKFITANGCGDSLVGGVLAGLSHTVGISTDYTGTHKAVALGVAAGVANTTTFIPGDFPLDLFQRIMSDYLVVTRVA